MLSGFAPWIVYWVLIGNVPFKVAVLIALAIAVAVFGLGRSFEQTSAQAKDKSAHVLEFGSVATFSVLAVLIFAVSEPALQRWIQPISSAGIFLVTLTSQLIGKPFVHEFAAAEQPDDVVKTGLFGRTTRLVMWIWIAALAGMTVSSVIPPILAANASILDTRAPLSFVFYWVIPFSLFGAAAVASRVVPARMLVGIDDVARETSFVAYDEATIDELYYLAQEHANREVGAGKEAYEVKVGGMGTPLTGDESRKSWPSTYKVRDRRH
jgi:hypothetical protein